MQQDSDGWSIGRLAEAAGLPVKTIRFYSDAGLLPSTRTPAGHRRYASADVARLQLIRSLRALDVDLPTITGLLADATGMQDVLRGHAKALEVRLQSVQRQLAVARAAAEAPAERTLARLHALPRIEAAERGQLLDRFWDDVLHAVARSDAVWFRTMGRPELPAHPTGAQLDAWLELAVLAADPDFRATTAANAAWFPAHAHAAFDPQAWQDQLGRALQLAAEAAAAGIDPSDPSARPALDAYVCAYANAFARESSPAFRAWLSQQFSILTDPRAERWWHLVAQVQPPHESPPRHAATTTWLHQALAHAVSPADPYRSRSDS